MSFKIGEKVVYPNHGVGVVEEIQPLPPDGVAASCYLLRLLGTNSRVTVPMHNSDRVGLRPLTRSQELTVVFRVLEEGTSVLPTSDWKGRYKQNLDKMKSGLLADVADVLKNLSWVQKQKSLSFREKKMYERARYLIVSEIALVDGRPAADVEGEVDRALDRSASQRPAPRPRVR